MKAWPSREPHPRGVAPFAAALCAGLALGTLTATSGATERPRRSSLAWSVAAGAESCIGEQQLASAVEQRLGRAVFVAPPRADVVIDGRVEPSTQSSGFRAHLVLTDRSGHVLGKRDLDTMATNCRALDDDLALVLALLIEPPISIAPPPDRTDLPPPVSTARTAAKHHKIPARSHREPDRASVEVGPAIARGLLPDIALGVNLRGEIVPSSFVPIQLGGAIWRGPTWGAARVGTASEGALLTLSCAFVSICPLVLGGPTARLRACGGGLLGTIRSQGFGFLQSTGSTQLLVAATVEGRFTWRVIGPLEVGFGIGLLAPLARASFVFSDSSGAERPLYRMGAVAGILESGVGVAFP